MNGEIYQICCLTAVIKEALHKKSLINTEVVTYADNTRFQCLGDYGITNGRTIDIREWADSIVKCGIKDVKMMMPINLFNRRIAGFINTSGCSLVIYWESGRVSYFTAHWEYESVNKEWNILYTEHEHSAESVIIPEFENNIKDFLVVITKIGDFADEINCPSFAKLFRNAVSNSEHCKDKIPLPTENLRIFSVASKTDVFGGMGSWNDEPPYLAQQKGLGDKYRKLSEELFLQIKLAILYSVNEW